MTTMAYVVHRGDGRWELRESRATPRGPRSRTLATYRVLTPDVVAHAISRSESGLNEAEIERACERSGVTGPRSASDIAAQHLIGELALGKGPSAVLRAQLVDALAGPVLEGAAAAHARNPTPLTAAERGEALRELLDLTDRLPARPVRPLSFPPIGRLGVGP